MKPFRFEFLNSRMVEDLVTKRKFAAIKTDQTYDTPLSNPPREKGARVYVLLSEELIRELANDDDCINMGHVQFVDINEKYNNEEKQSLEKKYKVAK